MTAKRSQEMKKEAAKEQSVSDQDMSIIDMKKSFRYLKHRHLHSSNLQYQARIIYLVSILILVVGFCVVLDLTIPLKGFPLSVSSFLMDV